MKKKRVYKLVWLRRVVPSIVFYVSSTLFLFYFICLLIPFSVLLFLQMNFGSKRLRMPPISPSSAPLEPVEKSVTKSELAKSKWKVLASAISQKNKIKNSKSDSEMLLKFPSYQVIHAEPIQDEDKSMLWFNITVPEFSNLSLKVRQKLFIFCFHTLGIWIPDIQLTETFKKLTFCCPVFKCLVFKWLGFSYSFSPDHLKTDYC